LQLTTQALKSGSGRRLAANAQKALITYANESRSTPALARSWNFSSKATKQLANGSKTTFEVLQMMANV